MINVKVQFCKRKIFIGLILIALITLNAFTLTYEKPEKDRRQNLAFAYNTLKYKTFGMESNDKPTPSNFREPFYPLILMVGMIISPQINLSEQDARCITMGKYGCMEYIIYLKVINKIFIALSAFISALLIHSYSNSAALSIVCFCLINFSGTLNVWADRFKSEALASCLIIISSYLLARLANSKADVKSAVLCGISFGLLTLTKAIFYYLIFVLFLLLLIWFIYKKRYFIEPLKISIFFIMGAYLIISPWLLRNVISLNSYSISQRGGMTLSFRAAYLDMTKKEYKYFIISRLSGISKHNNILNNTIKSHIDDKYIHEFQKKYDNDKYAKKYYRALKQYATQQLGIDDENNIDRFLKRESLNNILNNFDYNIALAIPFMIRGSSVERGYGFYPESTNNIYTKYFKIDTTKYHLSFPIINNIFFILSFFILAVSSFMKRNWQLFWFLFPSLYCFGMYSLFTQFFNRFSVPLIPTFVICGTLISWNIYKFIVNRGKYLF